MRRLNFDMPHGTIYGGHELFPNARYQQGGALFTKTGDCLTEDGRTPYAPVDVSHVPAAVLEEKEAEADGTKEAEQIVADAPQTLAGLQADVDRLEAELDKAKALPVTEESAQQVSDLQAELTKAKRKFTKENNKAAVMETSLANSKAKKGGK